MESSIDLACSSALGVLMVALPVSRSVAVARAHHAGRPVDWRVLGPSSRWIRVAMWALEPVAVLVAAAGISANAVTAFSLGVGAVAGLLVAGGHFGAASAALLVASLGDAIDGLVARRTGSATVGGAVFDASADRYQEALFLGGLAFFFREDPTLLALVLAALVGSFMVSYGSAKAEALGVPVPYGIMRRTERAVSFILGCALTPPAIALGQRMGWPSLAEHAPILVATAAVAVLANSSAVRRLTLVAAARSPQPPKRAPSARASQVSSGPTDCILHADGAAKSRV